MEVTVFEGIPEFGMVAKDDLAWASSRVLAQMFGKRHSDVMRGIRTLLDSGELSEEFGQRNFAQSYYVNEQSKKQPMYNLTRAGFTLVAMGFTGKAAIKFKEDYIKAFDVMEELIATRLSSKKGYLAMGEAIKEYLPEKPFTYSNESDMVNRIVLGMSAKQFREAHNLDKCEGVRDHLVEEILVKLDKAQGFNANLIASGLYYKNRKELISKAFKKE